MRKVGPIVLLVVIISSITNRLYAQFSGNNTLEYQLGQLPNDTSSISTIYDRFIANFDHKFVKASVTLEQFHTPRSGSSYLKINQFSLQYKSNPLEIKIGNFYETLGRGLLLRSFEIPGAILEDLSYRSRHYFNRDIFGLSARFQHKNFTSKLLYGSPLNYVFPPSQALKDRRADTIVAIYSDYSIKKQTLGVAAMQHSNDGDKKVFLMVTASGNISSLLSYYTEMASTTDDFKGQTSYAYYGGLNFSVNRLGVSAEYKNYKNFVIGSGINEPPALVKEHSYKVLNRSTHVLQPINEKGYQVELFFTFPNLSTLTFNNTLAINDFSQTFIFQEFFLEYDFPLNERHDLKLFADYAEDPFKLEEQRISTGVYIDWEASKTSAIKTNYEFQTFKRLDKHYQNHIFILGYAYQSKWIGNLITEYSNDSFIIDQGDKIWVGANLKYQINRSHNLQLFAGERRGGPACNAGICYEVLDFKGAELRLTSRF